MKGLRSWTRSGPAGGGRNGLCFLLFVNLGRKERGLDINFVATVSFSANTIVAEVLARIMAGRNSRAGCLTPNHSMFLHHMHHRIVVYTESSPERFSQIHQRTAVFSYHY